MATTEMSKTLLLAKDQSITWSQERVAIDLVKTDKGLGFSILDYRETSRQSRQRSRPRTNIDSAIVVYSLVPGGAAQADGRLAPGDRLISINGVSLEKMTLDQALVTLKSIPIGTVQILVAKPLPSQSDTTTDLSGNNVMSNGNGNHVTMVTSKSPQTVPSSTKRAFGGKLPPMPASMEQTVRLHKGTESLGVTLEAADGGANGGVVRAIQPGGTFARDSRVSLNDFITSINGESLRLRSSAQMRAIIKRSSLLCDTEITVKFITHRNALVFRQSAISTAQERRDAEDSKAAEQARARLSPRVFPKFYRPTLTPPLTPRVNVQRKHSTSIASDTNFGPMRQFDTQESLKTRVSSDSSMKDITNLLVLSPEILRKSTASAATAAPAVSAAAAVTADDESRANGKKGERANPTESGINDGKINENAPKKTESAQNAELETESDATLDSLCPFWKLIFKNRRIVTIERETGQPLGIGIARKQLRIRSMTTNVVGKEDESKDKDKGRKGSVKEAESRNDVASPVRSVARESFVKQKQSISVIFIQRLQKDSPACRAASMRIGDCIIRVNESTLVNLPIESASEILRTAQNPARLLLGSIDFTVTRNNRGAVNSINPVLESSSRSPSVNTVDRSAASNKQRNHERRAASDSRPCSPEQDERDDSSNDSIDLGTGTELRFARYVR